MYVYYLFIGRNLLNYKYIPILWWIFILVTIRNSIRPKFYVDLFRAKPQNYFFRVTKKKFELALNMNLKRMINSDVTAR